MGIVTKAIVCLAYGLQANLPSTAAEIASALGISVSNVIPGIAFFCTDTDNLYVWNGTSMSQVGVSAGSVTIADLASVEGNGTKIQLTSQGTTTSGDVVTYDGSGNVQDSGTLLSSLAPIASPTFTGTVTIPTVAVTTLSGNPTFSGTPVFDNALALPNGTAATTQTSGDNSTKVATTAFVESAVGAISLDWNALQNPTGNLTLNNAGYSTTFDQTSAASWTWANTTASVSGTGATLVVSGKANHATNSGQVTLNTTGATLIVAYLMDDDASNNPTISDSLSNGWNYTTTYTNGSFRTRVAYAYAASGGGALVTGSDTFTVSGGFVFGIIYAFSGTLTTSAVFETINGNTQAGVESASSLTFQTGPITPIAGNIVVTGFGWNSAGPTSAAVAAGGGNDTFTNVITQTNAADETGAAAIILSASGAPVNAIWTPGTLGTPAVTLIASFKVATPTATNQSSPTLTIGGTIWNGSASVNDQWTLQAAGGNAVNPASILSLSHTGSSGPAIVAVPALKIGNDTGFSRGSAGVIYAGDGAPGDSSATLQAWQLLASPSTTQSSSGTNSPVIPSIGFAGTNTGLVYDSAWLEIAVSGVLNAAFTGAGLQIQTSGAYSWVSGGVRGTYDTNISRNSAGVVQVGTSSANASGTLLAKVVTVSDTAANADLILQNPTTATVSTTNASPLAEFSANYWTGSASATDTWTIGSSLAAGSNGLPTLTITHSGSTPSGNVAPVIGLAGGSFGTTINANIALNFQVGSTFQGYFQNGSLSMSSLAAFAFLPSNVPTGSPDTFMTRSSAGVLAIGAASGVGTATGQLNLKTVLMTAASAAPTSAGTAGTAGQIIYNGGLIYFCSVTGAAGSATWNKLSMTSV